MKVKIPVKMARAVFLSLFVLIMARAYGDPALPALGA